MEHIIGVIKKHAMFRQEFRGAHFLLNALVRLTGDRRGCVMT